LSRGTIAFGGCEAFNVNSDFRLLKKKKLLERKRRKYHGERKEIVREYLHIIWGERGVSEGWGMGRVQRKMWKEKKVQSEIAHVSRENDAKINVRRGGGKKSLSGIVKN